MINNFRFSETKYWAVKIASLIYMENQETLPGHKLRARFHLETHPSLLSIQLIGNLERK